MIRFAVASNLIHHPHKVDGVLPGLGVTTRQGFRGCDFVWFPGSRLGTHGTRGSASAFSGETTSTSVLAIWVACLNNQKVGRDRFPHPRDEHERVVLLRAAEVAIQSPSGKAARGSQARQDPIHLVWMVNKVVRLPPCAFWEARPLWAGDSRWCPTKPHVTNGKSPAACRREFSGFPAWQQWQGLPRKA